MKLLRITHSALLALVIMATTVTASASASDDTNPPQQWESFTETNLVTGEPEGYTALWLLGESHFAIHTFPEEQKTYIELSSCNLEYYEFFKANVYTNGFEKAKGGGDF